MASHPHSRWRIVRMFFRRVRTGVLWIVLALLGALLYFNQIGLPGFLKKPLVQKLRNHGLDLQFSRIRWRWDRGVVAENVRFGGTNDLLSPTLVAGEAGVQLDYRALALFRFQIESLALRQGRLTWPVRTAKEKPRALTIDQLQAELRLQPGDIWELDHFQAHFAGGTITVSGAVTNASALRQWTFPKQGQRPEPGALQDRLDRLARVLEEIHFSTPPDLRLDLRGDARQPENAALSLTLDAPDAATPWGDVHRAVFLVRMGPAPDSLRNHAEINLRADAAQTPWGSISNLALNLRAASLPRSSNSAEAILDLTASKVGARWGSIHQARVAANWTHPLSSLLPHSGRVQANAQSGEFPSGTFGPSTLDVTFSRATGEVAPEPSWSWWTNLAPYAMQWEARVADVDSEKLAAEEIACGGKWVAPEISAGRVAARLYGGRVDAQAQLNVATRRLAFAWTSEFDLQKISALLTPGGRAWLAQYTWQQPPDLWAEGNLVLPAWTNGRPNWRTEVKPTVQLLGHVRLERSSFRGVPAGSAETRFTYTNEVWRLPDLTVTRPEGRLQMTLQSDERTREYCFTVQSTIDPRALRPMLRPPQQRGLDLLEFAQPPRIDGQIWGRWRDRDRTGFAGRVMATNATLRGQQAEWAWATVQYTNRCLTLIEPRVQQTATQQLAAARLTFDFNARQAFLTNGFSTADPLIVARALSPKIGSRMEPYRFGQPPVVHAEGIIPLTTDADADLHFEVNGRTFEWWKFKTPRIAGRVDWVKNRLELNQVRADCCGGAAEGWARFDFDRSADGIRTDCKFDLSMMDADLHSLMAAWSETKTNRLEGLLSARLAISAGQPGDWQSWQGHGRVLLRDGLIWDIPVFGIVSPVLDGIMPGLGSSRATEASATFTITNGVGRSSDLDIKASHMRLKYAGTADLQGRVNARVEAELLRDTWMIGRVLSLALWPVSKVFEYQITGTVRQPKTEPVYFVPKLVLLPFHPIRGLRELFQEPPSAPRTNQPPTRDGGQ